MTSTVYIAKSVYGGDGLGRLGDGRVIFVPGAYAGENVKAEIVEEKRHFVKARLVEVVESSPERITAGPSVPGMVYSTLSYTGELAAKEEQLRDFFARARIAIPAITSLNEGLPNANYRNKVAYHFEKVKAKGEGEVIRIGYRQEPDHTIVDVTDDPLAVPAINAELPSIRRAILQLLTTGPKAVRDETARKGHVTIRWSARSGVQWWIGDAPKGIVLKETTCDKVFEVPADGFYQVNPAAGEALAKSVVKAYKAQPTKKVLDLYCGVGVFGLCCAPESLIGIESGRQAIDFAKKNAAEQKHANAKFFAEEVGRNMRRIAIGRDTTVIVDPPRDGLEPRVPDWLAQSNAPRIFYVSCDPATLMRDLRIMTQTYDVASVSWVNMFPRTARFETFVTLEKRG